MDFFRRIKSYVLGEDLAKSSGSPSRVAEGEDAGDSTKKVSVPKQSALQQPVLQNAGFGSQGGVQGLDWYTKNLKEDSDGDVADEFLEEHSPVAAGKSTKSKAEHLSSPLQVQKQNLKSALPGDVVVLEGNVHMLPPR